MILAANIEPRPPDMVATAFRCVAIQNVPNVNSTLGPQTKGPQRGPFGFIRRRNGLLLLGDLGTIRPLQSQEPYTNSGVLSNRFARP